MGWLEYHASLAPFPVPPSEGVSQWGGRSVVNLLGDDLQLPPVLDAACYDKSERGPAANRGLVVHDGFDEAVVLSEIVRQGEGDGMLRGVLTRLRIYSLTEEDADWLMSLQLDKLHPLQRAWVEEKALYLFPTHSEEWLWNKEKLKALNDMGGPASRAYRCEKQRSTRKRRPRR